MGFEQVRRRGSHVVMARLRADGRRVVCVVPLHAEVAIGTLRGILRQADLSAEELIANLR